MKMKSQLDLLRKISPIKRLEAAFRLSALTRELALANIKSQNPNADKKELNNLLLQRYVGG
ncbi:MAG: hypothetical protein AAB838_00565 [Patescibacteria group bacterium]